MDENVAKAVIEQWASMEADHEPDGWPAVRMRDLTIIRARLVEWEAENDRANGLLRECLGFMQSQSIDQRSWGEKLSLGEKITAHLSENGHE